jgi:hypothetical protein
VSWSWLQGTVASETGQTHIKLKKK